MIRPSDFDQDYFDGPKTGGYTNYVRSKTVNVDTGDDETTAYHRRFFEAYRPHFENKKILEIGSAKGFLIEDFLKFGVGSISGVECSEYAINCASSEIQSHILHANALDVISDFDSNYFDTLIALRFLPCLMDDEINEFISEASRISLKQIYLIDARESYNDYLFEKIKNVYNIKTQAQWQSMMPNSSIVVIQPFLEDAF